MESSVVVSATGLADSLELEALRSKRDSEVEKLDRQYITALEKLKVKLTKAGRLEDALEVKREIEGKARNRLRGKWKYTYDNRVHVREFTEGLCILTAEVTKGGRKKKVFSKKYRLISPSFAIVEGVGIHEIREDGKLSIHGENFVGVRVER